MQIFHQTTERLPAGHNYTFKFEAASVGPQVEPWASIGKIVSFPFQVASQLYRLFFKVEDPELTTSTPAVGKALLKGHRHNPENGLFVTDSPFLQLAERVYPEMSPDDLIFTCHETWTNKYRRAVLSFIKPKNLETHQAGIGKCIEYCSRIGRRKWKARCQCQRPISDI